MTDKDNAKNFNLKQFNLDFEEDLKKRNAERYKREDATLKQLNTTIERPHVINMSVGEILVGIKDTWFGIMDDLLMLKFNASTFTKDDRLIFIGLTIVIIVILTYIIHYLSNIGDEYNKKEKIVKIYHINQSNLQ